MNCIFFNSDCNGDLKHRMPLAATESSAAMCEYHWTLRQHDVRVAASTGCTCWEGYERVPGTKPCAPGSCRKQKKSSLKTASRESLVSALEKVLGNAFSMYVRTHGAHWNVRGSDFAQYHELFETIYEDVYSSIDPLAENIRKLDADAPASVNQFSELDGLSEAPESDKSEQELTKDVMDANRVVLESLVKAFSIADDENEQGIANFLAERIDMHQKWNWQLSSSISKQAENIDEPGFLEEEESFKGRRDDDEDTPGSKFDELPSLEDRTEDDREDDEDDRLQTDKEDMMEEGQLDLPRPKSSVKCAACGDLACLGHEEDSINHMILIAHASEDHSSCHPDGCSSVGRSFHGHVCSNCGGETPCMGTRTASVCDTFDGFCKTCFVELAGIRTALDSKELNAYMRSRNVTHQPPVTQAVVDRAMAQGHSLETAMEEVGQHRPKEEKAAAAEEPFKRGILRKGPNGEPDELSVRMQEWADDKLEEYEGKHEGEPSALLKTLKWFELTGSESGSFVPPSSVASNAKRGLELRKKHNRGGTEVGVARARDLSNRKGLSYSTIKRMKAYFDRHEVDKKGEGWGKDSAGYIAWLLWGGDAGRSWANKIIKQHEKESRIASNECGTCGHGWSNHGKNASCSCCADFDKRKASTDLPDWLKEAAEIIAADAEVIDLDAYRRRSRGVPPFHPSMLPAKESPFHSIQPPKKPKIYDQDEELTFKPGDEPQTHVDIQTGEVTRWHPGLQTPRGGDE